jgi:hypothetical protein
MGKKRGKTKANMERPTKKGRQKHCELVEGMARCVFNAGMEKEIQLNDVVYVREISNMRGHCVILRNKKLPLIGYHLDRFELLKDEE